MELGKETVKHVAKIARINLTPIEIEKLTPELNEIILAFSKINELDCSDTKISIQPVEVKNSLREDIVEESLSVEEALKNTEHKEEKYFRGPSAK